MTAQNGDTVNEGAAGSGQALAQRQRAYVLFQVFPAFCQWIILTACQLIDILKQPEAERQLLHLGCRGVGSTPTGLETG